MNPVTSEGRAVADLFNIALLASAGVLVLVFGLLGIMLVRFRARRGEPLAEPSRSSGNRRLELAWTIGPLLLVIVLFALTVRTMRAVAGQEDTPALVVDVIGHQWWWEYRFRAGAAQVNQDAAVTANELHLAVGELVRLDLDSADVQHDFWVPQFGWKRDMYPGKRNVLYATLHDRGTFDGTCSVYCGTQHAWMRIRVVSESPDQFAAWLQVTQSPASRPVTADAQRGEQVFMANTCVNCHTIRGTSASGTVGPDLTHVGSRTTLGAGVLANTPEDMYRWIRNPHAAKPGVLMPAYDSLSESDLRAMAAYLTGLR